MLYKNNKKEFSDELFKNPTAEYRAAPFWAWNTTLSKELLTEAKDLLDKGAYKSANNRAFYAIEKSVKALLATKKVEVVTHNGSLKQFNYLFIFKSVEEYLNAL